MTPYFDASTLSEQHPLYAGKSTNETARIRAFILAGFETSGLPEGALPYVLEELQSGQHPYPIAAAARALRGTTPDPAFVGYLLKARRNIQYMDAPVTFDAPNATSAMEEIQRTLTWLGAADAAGYGCCDIAFPADRTRRTLDLDVALEDQDGRAVGFGEFFRGKFSVVAFFYTRCDNPEKCSLTISKLAQLQDAIESGPLNGQVRIAAMTYDPAYDLPHRMKRFGKDRGIRFHEDVRCLRACDGLDALRAPFDLGVNFAGSIVNRHRIELYVLDARGDIVATFSRMQWDVAAVVAELQSQLSGPPGRGASLWSVIPPLLLAILPKCPLCLGAYLTAIGLGGIQAPFRTWWTLPLSIALLLLHLWLTYRRSRQTHRLAPLAFALTGATALLAGGVFGNLRPVAIAGAALLVTAALLGARGRTETSSLIDEIKPWHRDATPFA